MGPSGTVLGGVQLQAKFSYSLYTSGGHLVSHQAICILLSPILDLQVLRGAKSGTKAGCY